MPERLLNYKSLDETSTPIVSYYYSPEIKYVPNTEDVVSLFSRDEEVYLLRQTGFDMRRQIDMWSETSNKLLSQGMPEREVLEILNTKNAEDLKHFCYEYVYQNLALPIDIDFSILDGKVQLIPPKYSQQPYSEVISESERGGSVKKAFLNVENFLVHASPGSMAIITSPDGWSGMTDRDGKPLDHKDTQIYVFKISEIGQLEGVTLRLDMTLADCEGFVANEDNTKNVNLNMTSERERIVNVVDSFRLLPPSNHNTFESVVDRLEEIKRSPNAFYKYDKDCKKWIIRTFDEMRESLRNQKSLKYITNNTESLINKYLVEISDLEEISPASFKKMAIELASTVLNIFDTEVTQKKMGVDDDNFLLQNLFNSSYIQTINPTTLDRNEEMLYNLQQVGGCAGGACSLNRISQGNSMSGVFAQMLVPQGEWFKTNCPMCNGKEVSAKYEGDNLIGDCGHTKKVQRSI